jgi:hypothetical protein
MAAARGITRNKRKCILPPELPPEFTAIPESKEMTTPRLANKDAFGGK